MMAATLTREVEEAGYTLHDVERYGEKGFHRLARGFCSRPDSRAMRRHFLDLGDSGHGGAVPSQFDGGGARAGRRSAHARDRDAALHHAGRGDEVVGAMPVEDQMRFQWAFIRAGLGAVGERRD